MLRRIVRIEEEACVGCGACAAACHEGAIEMIGGKARLTREDYCDGLGDCLPACPADAISFEVREAPAYDEAAVLAAKKEKAGMPAGCPGSAERVLPREANGTAQDSCLGQWPVQLKLLPVTAPYYAQAQLLIAADCTAYAYGAFHQDFIRGRVTMIGCPKLDAGDYAEKLTAIFAANSIMGVTVTRMEVPCCGGLEHAVKRAILASGKKIPCRVITISAQGKILSEK